MGERPRMPTRRRVIKRHLHTTVGGTRHLIAFEAGKPMRRKNRTTGYRWYRSYKVPCDPRINPELHAATFRLRLDTTDEDKNRKRGRAENLRLHPEGTQIGRAHV